MSEDKKSAKNPPVIDQKFLQLRTIIISEAIDEKIASAVMRQALLLEAEDAKKPVKVFINSPGGEVSSGFAVYDILKYISCPVYTIVSGLAASMGSIISLAGCSGGILALPNARIMIHQPLLGNARGHISDLKIHAEEIVKTKEHIIGIYMDKTGKTRDVIKQDIERDHWFSAAEAKKYGLVDRVITTGKDLEKLIK